MTSSLPRDMCVASNLGAAAGVGVRNSQLSRTLGT